EQMVVAELDFENLPEKVAVSLLCWIVHTGYVDSNCEQFVDGALTVDTVDMINIRLCMLDMLIHIVNNLLSALTFDTVDIINAENLYPEYHQFSRIEDSYLKNLRVESNQYLDPVEKNYSIYVFSDFER
ncbi:10773_t:CDS:2, partial [Racocetra persica]